ncbi:MAG: hypothetical protein SVR08_05510 [Spirochaetota bacterium]|nr:hypothetical protein [Spirochaetota bacterium]
MPIFMQIFISLLLITPFIYSCSSTKIDRIMVQNNAFLKADPFSDELYRVLLLSDRYIVSQMKLNDIIERVKDVEGDTAIREKLNKFDKINENREGIITVWLFPDSGELMKLRPKKMTYIREIDNLLIEDIKRWKFRFPQEVIEPVVFDIKYRIILQKKQSDEEIMKEVRKNLREKKR